MKRGGGDVWLSCVWTKKFTRTLYTHTECLLLCGEWANRNRLYGKQNSATREIKLGSIWGSLWNGIKTGRGFRRMVPGWSGFKGVVSLECLLRVSLLPSILSLCHAQDSNSYWALPSLSSSPPILWLGETGLWLTALPAPVRTGLLRKFQGPQLQKEER